MQALGGQGVDDVDWPRELHVFKTADTSHYVVATATAAKTCATCLVPFAAGDRRSLTVEVRTPDPAPPGAAFAHRQFSAEVHHRFCHRPGCQVVRSTPTEVSAQVFDRESDMHYVLVTLTGTDGQQVPALVFTTADPIVVRDLERAEGRSAWISTYLELGFELFGRRRDRLDHRARPRHDRGPGHPRRGPLLADRHPRRPGGHPPAVDQEAGRPGIPAVAPNRRRVG